MYTRTGQVTKGGVVLPVYRCARGSKSLELFHLHLNRFIPGTSASGCHFQMYLLEGLTRWNEERAQAVVGTEKMRMKCYAGKKQHSLFQLTQRLLGVTLLESYSKPLKYTGELIRMSYLYAQTGQELQIFPDDPDEPFGIEEIVLEDDEESEEDSCVAGSGPASWPDASRLVEAIFKELCALYPGSRREPQPVPSTSSVFRNLQPLETREKEARAGPSETPSISAPSTSSSTQYAAPPLPATAHATAHATHVPKSTAWNRKKIQQLQEAAAKEGVTLKVRAPSINICRHCGLRKIRQTGHRLLTKASRERVNYCPMAAKGQRPEEWLASL
ncbi:hypothetical protein XENOCAPTIV_024007 [Xenoophorus captivus]|uniref:Uncharacterized protein n=1 Tax=Xenoophorus captivus TaxID=1517983 RepID=A0ABV0RLM5_9TELE